MKNAEVSKESEAFAERMEAAVRQLQAAISDSPEDGACPPFVVMCVDKQGELHMMANVETKYIMRQMSQMVADHLAGKSIEMGLPEQGGHGGH